PAHAVECVSDRGRVMRKVVVHADTVDVAAQLEPATHAAEPGQRLQCDLLLDACVPRRDERGERVFGVVPAEHTPVDGADAAGTLPDLDMAVARITWHELPVGRDPGIDRVA